MRRLAPLALLLVLVACEPAEKRAEAHYQRALALLAEGDSARAAVELRNVFRLDGDHTAARLAYARLLVRDGDREKAMGQYLRLAEQDPGNLEGQRELATLALDMGDPETASFHAAQAHTLAPADPEVRALRATLDWRRGTTADRSRAVAEAEAVAAEAPQVVAAQLLLVTARLAAGDAEGALARADAALAAQPAAISPAAAQPAATSPAAAQPAADSAHPAAGAAILLPPPGPGPEALHLARLAALERLAEGSGDQAPVGAALKEMAARFPGNAAVADALVAWHLRTGDPAGAEALLRARADAVPDPAANPGPALRLGSFLLQVRGPAAARDELEARAAAAGPAGSAPFRRAVAGLDFAAGRPAEAIAALRDLLKDAQPSDATRELQLTLAEMLAASGTPGTEAATLVDTILAGDPGQGAALKLRARMALAGDQPEAAVRDLRTALAGAPGDAEALTLLAFAHGRTGARDLMGESLARAVEVSDRAPAPSARYAGFLLQDGRSGPAEGVVIDALRRAPADPDLLALLGQIQLSRQDWPRAAQVAGRLQAVAGAGTADPQTATRAAALAAALEARSLVGRDRTAEALARLVPPPGAPLDVTTAGPILRGLAAGEAAAWLDARLAATPGDVGARLLRADLAAAAGDTAGAEAGIAAAIAAAPARPEPRAAQFRLLATTGQPGAAAVALADGLAAVPPAGARPLLMLRAGLREAVGDRAGALADYRMIRAADLATALSGGADAEEDPLLVNNLASLLAAGGTPEEMEAAARLARQLRGSPVPQYRDTLGSILLARGEAAAGLVELDPAAAALPGNGAVQLHRAEALRALGRATEAREAYARALAATDPPLSQAEASIARSALATPDKQAGEPSGG